MKSLVPFTCTLLLASLSLAGDTHKKTIAPPEEDRWKVALSIPGWIAGVSGDVGLNGFVTHADVNPSDLLRHADMLATFRGEVSKGRFGITADFVYMSLSDGIGTDTVVQKLDVQLDQIMGDLGMRWRVLEGSRGWVDVTAGVRYTNLYQKLVTQPNDERISEFSGDLVDEVGERLRAALSASGLGEIVAQRLVDRILVADPRGQPVPIAALRGRDGVKFRRVAQRIISSRQAELTAAVQATQQAAGAARVAAQERVAGIKRDISNKIAAALEDSLSARVSRTDDWFDPYVGLRARYNFTDRCYFLVKGDVGGFGVGSQLTWQAEGAFGYQLTQSLYAEAGYRALSVDYEGDGLTYDMITHGAQITMGVQF